MEKLPPQICHRKQAILATLKAKSPTVVAFTYSHNNKTLLLGSFCGGEEVNVSVLANITVQSKLGFAICSRETATSRVFTIKHDHHAHQQETAESCKMPHVSGDFKEAFFLYCWVLFCCSASTYFETHCLYHAYSTFKTGFTHVWIIFTCSNNNHLVKRTIYKPHIYSTL